MTLQGHIKFVVGLQFIMLATKRHMYATVGPSHRLQEEFQLFKMTGHNSTAAYLRYAILYRVSK